MDISTRSLFALLSVMFAGGLIGLICVTRDIVKMAVNLRRLHDENTNHKEDGPQA